MAARLPMSAPSPDTLADSAMGDPEEPEQDVEKDQRTLTSSRSSSNLAIPWNACDPVERLWNVCCPVECMQFRRSAASNFRGSICRELPESKTVFEVLCPSVLPGFTLLREVTNNTNHMSPPSRTQEEPLLKQGKKKGKQSKIRARNSQQESGRNSARGEWTKELEEEGLPHVARESLEPLLTGVRHHLGSPPKMESSDDSPTPLRECASSTQTTHLQVDGRERQPRTPSRFKE